MKAKAKGCSNRHGGAVMEHALPFRGQGIMNIRPSASILVASGLLAAMLPATASADLEFSPRVGAIIGAYRGNGSTEASQSGASGDISGGFAASYGLTTGLRISSKNFDRLLFDASIDAMTVEFDAVSSSQGFADDDLESEAIRSDLLLSAVYLLTDRVSLLAGYRGGWQGDGLFDDQVLIENGGFAGLGFGGMRMGPRLGAALSAVYNFNRVDLELEPDAATGEQRSVDFSYPGFNLNASLAFLGTPHVLRLRFQRFEGDTTFERVNPDVQNSSEQILLDVEETYIHLYYTYTLGR